MNFAKVIIAATTLIRDDQDNILMIENPDRGWEMPGGRAEVGEDILTCLNREVLEETGITVNDCILACIYSNLTASSMIFAFLSNYASGTPTTSPESINIEWVRIDDCIKRASHPRTKAFMKDLIAFDGKVLYRTYAVDPYDVIEERYI